MQYLPLLAVAGAAGGGWWLRGGWGALVGASLTGAALNSVKAVAGDRRRWLLTGVGVAVAGYATYRIKKDVAA